MDPAKVEFLFDRVPEGFDVDDPDDRAELLAIAGDDRATLARSALRAIVAEQVAGDDPPEVWATAQRLLGLGLSSEAVMRQLCVALAHAVRTGMDAGDRAFDATAYEAALESLPLPTMDDVEAAAVAAVGPGSTLEDLRSAVLTGLGRHPDDPLAPELVDHALDALMDEGPIALLAGDQVVDVMALTESIVLTHRLGNDERTLDVLRIGFDLAAFVRRSTPRLPDGTKLEPVELDGHDLGWEGPPGWLAAYEPGTVLAVRADAAGVVTLDLLADEPAPDPALVGLLRAAYDTEVDEPGLPVAAEDLLLAILARAGDAFSRPRPPLDDLCAAAGLERRGVSVAHDDSVWAEEERLWQLRRILDALESKEDSAAALRCLGVADSADPSPEDLRRALGDLHNRAVAEVVMDELDRGERAQAFAEALLGVATTGRQKGVARWVAAVAAEDAGQVEVAEAHLHLGLEADPDSGALVERCAWYASDRGRAREALVLWQRLGDRRSADIATVEPFARRSGPKLGRNDPCWCGSGRKHKSCHPGQEPVTPLPDRVGWLCRKATAYLEHGGADARDLILSLAHRRATGTDEDSVLDALSDPIVIDAALTEGGWFAGFVEDRGPLLPDDEALLAQSWLLVPRTVYEVTEVSPGAGLRARDLRTGDIVDVRERTFSQEARPGSFVCARAVPDGETHQFVGGLFPVAPGSESSVLELCEAGDPMALCTYVGSLHRPPVLHTREGEPIVTCTAVLEVPDAAEAVAILDRHYRRDDEMWVEMHAMGDNDDILRATLTLDGDHIEVQTHSEARVDRVLALLGEVLPDARLLSDRREPLAPGEVPSPPRLPDPGVVPGPEAVDQIQDWLERRWLDESVPALAGLTPRQASADPTRRDELRRLIASFPEADSVPDGGLIMRPDRLRELLDL